MERIIDWIWDKTIELVAQVPVLLVVPIAYAVGPFAAPLIEAASEWSAMLRKELVERREGDGTLTPPS